MLRGEITIPKNGEAQDEIKVAAGESQHFWCCKEGQMFEYKTSADDTEVLFFFFEGAPDETVKQKIEAFTFTFKHPRASILR